MKKTIIVLLVFSFGAGAALLYAGSGNLIVTGQLGVDTTSPSPGVLLDVAGNARVGSLGFWGTLPSSSYGLYANESISNPGSSLSGIYTILYPTYTTLNGTTQTQYSHAGIFETVPTINTSVTQNGYDRAILAQVLRNCNGTSADDGGTLATLAGAQVVYGHYNSNTSGQPPVTSNAYGLSVTPYYLTGTINNMYDIYLAPPATGGTAANRWGIYQNNTANNFFGGNVGIGTTDMGTGGSAALLFGSGAMPTAQTDVAGLYAQYSSTYGAVELFAFDESGNVSQISAHAQEAPDFLYDSQDGLPMIVKEVQYFLGYVRYTNKTRMARLAGMTDADKSALSPSQRVCVITESFADHQARTGEQLTLLVWEQEQAAIQQAKDAQRQAALSNQAALTAAIAQTTQALASATSDVQPQLQQILADLQLQLGNLVIPPVYQMKPVPPRLQAALNNQ